MVREGASADKARTAPVEDDPRKPDSPPDLRKPSWVYTAKKAATEFSRDQCTDLAAALTYYAVLALFPALLALVSLLGIFGQGESTTNALLDMVREIGQGEAAEQLRGPISQMTQTGSAGFALVLGMLGALWSASGYVGAFGRAMNRVYQIDEGRPFWKLRPLQLLLTVVGVLLAAAVLVGLVVSGPVATSVGRAIGLGDSAVTAWNLAKWPVILLIVVVLVALLYHATPNIRQSRFRWVSVGAGIAIVTWIVASLLFGVYVSSFSHYNKTYGSLAGVIVFLLWLWITNLALLLGAEVDAELERARELQAGIEAERTLQLPPRTAAPRRSARRSCARGSPRVVPCVSAPRPQAGVGSRRPPATRHTARFGWRDAPREQVCRVVRPRFGRSPHALAHWSGCLTRAVASLGKLGGRHHPR